MNRFIRRIGDVSARRPWTTIGAWAVLAALVVVLSGALGGAFADDFSAPGSESAEAMELLEERFPAVAGGTAVAVFAAPDGEQLARLPAGHRVGAGAGRGDRARRDRERPVRDRPGLGRRAGRVTPRSRWTCRRPSSAATRRPSWSRRPRSRPAPTACRPSSAATPRSSTPRRSPRGAEAVGLVAALVVLLVAFGTVVAALVPIVLALVAVGVGLGGIVLLAGGADGLHRRADHRRDGRAGRRHRLRPVHRLPVPREPHRRAGQPRRRCPPPWARPAPPSSSPAAPSSWRWPPSC